MRTHYALFIVHIIPLLVLDFFQDRYIKRPLKNRVTVNEFQTPYKKEPVLFSLVLSIKCPQSCSLDIIFHLFTTKLSNAYYVIRTLLYSGDTLVSEIRFCPHGAYIRKGRGGKQQTNKKR